MPYGRQIFRSTVVKSAPNTVTRWAQRLSLSLVAMVPERDTYARDISHAYVQSDGKLYRNIYLEPLPEMGINSDYLLKASKPLYGIPESGLFWFDTYHSHHKNVLGMDASQADPYFLPYTRNHQVMYGLSNIAMKQV